MYDSATGQSILTVADLPDGTSELLDRPLTIEPKILVEDIAIARTVNPPKCTCSLDESCPICKDYKLSLGVGPKHDKGKLRYSLIPPEATEALASVLTFGATKYAPNSWQSVPNAKERYMDALYRHLEAYRSGETNDDDSGLNHLWHAITNLAFLIHFDRKVNEC